MRLIRPLVDHLDPYVPGEQPKVRGLVKLNTNENPYPPSPKVLQAIRGAVDERLRLYPNPTAQKLREKLARLHRCEPENIVVTNGSDEFLAMAVRGFAEPAPMGGCGLGEPGKASPSTVQYLWPCYSLYPVLISIHGARARAVALREDFSLPSVEDLRQEGVWDFKAALSFVTTPNAPSGRGYATEELEALCRAQRGVVVLDEAYVDFAEGHAMELALKCPNVLVARTFSKAYSLCFQRVGYAVGAARLIQALQKIRDSYNVNGLGQAAAEATLADLPYYRANFRRVIATRERLGQALTGLGFGVLPSQTNFLLVRPPKYAAKTWLEKLRERKVLVRWFANAAISGYLRITIGTEEQTEALLRAVQRILK